MLSPMGHWPVVHRLRLRSQCREPGFNSWSGNATRSHMPQLRPSADKQIYTYIHICLKVAIYGWELKKIPTWIHPAQVPWIDSMRQEVSVTALLEGAIPRQQKWGERKAPWRIGRKYKVVHSQAGLASRRDTASPLMICRVSPNRWYRNTMPRKSPWWRNGEGICLLALHHLLSFIGQGSPHRVNFPVLLGCVTCLPQEPLWKHGPIPNSMAGPRSLNVMGAAKDLRWQNKLPLRAHHGQGWHGDGHLWESEEAHRCLIQWGCFFVCFFFKYICICIYIFFSRINQADV